MTALVEDDYRKLKVHKLSTLVWNQWKRMFLPPTLSGGRGQLVFVVVDCETWWGKDTHLNTSHEDVRTQKFMNPIFMGGLQKELYTLDATQRSSMLELQQKTRKKIQGLSALSFSLWYVVSLCLANTVDSASILSSFLLATTYKL